VTAEANKAVAEAKGVAAANDAKTRSITPALIKWKELEIEMVKANKWNGVQPSTVIGSGATPLLKLN